MQEETLESFLKNKDLLSNKHNARVASMISNQERINLPPLNEEISFFELEDKILEYARINSIEKDEELKDIFKGIQAFINNHRDYRRRMEDASFLIYDWDGYYDLETQTGNAKELASLIYSAYKILQNKGWLHEDPIEQLLNLDNHRTLINAKIPEKYAIRVEDTHIIWMFRYCIHRSSYAVSDGVNAILSNWHILTDSTKHLIVKEIGEKFEQDGEIMWKCDKESWQKILDRFNSENE